MDDVRGKIQGSVWMMLCWLAVGVAGVWNVAQLCSPSLMRTANCACMQRRLHEAFDRLDVDKSGYITKENLRDIMGTDYDPKEVCGILFEPFCCTLCYF